ncbi:MAG: hypothetical protein P4M05_28210 [Bradyrhizobium sp.]|nr:hypothetical protein [Bradyrhizobium sp.]
MRIEITKEQRDALAHLDTPFAEEIVKAYDAAMKDMEASLAAIDSAQGMYVADDINIDATPAVSIGADGVWVEAWVLVEDD